MLSVLGFVVLYCVMWCHIVLRCVTLCYVALCCVLEDNTYSCTCKWYLSNLHKLLNFVYLVHIFIVINAKHYRTHCTSRCLKLEEIVSDCRHTCIVSVDGPKSREWAICSTCFIATSTNRRDRPSSFLVPRAMRPQSQTVHFYLFMWPVIARRCGMRNFVLRIPSVAELLSGKQFFIGCFIASAAEWHSVGKCFSSLRRYFIADIFDVTAAELQVPLK